MTKELRFAIGVSLCALVIVQVLAAFGFNMFLWDYLPAVFQGGMTFAALGMFTPTAFILHILTRPKRIELGWTLLAGVALSIFIYWWVRYANPRPLSDHLLLSAIQAGFGIASVAVLAWKAIRAGAKERDLARHILYVTSFVCIMFLAMGSCVNFATALQPGTFDLLAFHADASLGFQPSTLFALYGVVVPGFKTLLAVAYAAIPVIFPVIYAMQLNSRNAPPVNFIKVWTVGILACYFTYFLYPVAGPLYAFGDKAFPAFLPALEFLQKNVTILSPAPRNGMPSMHFGWALLFWMNAGLLPDPKLAKWIRAFAAVTVALTGLATLTLGEHYLVDLVVAVPFVIALQALCTDALPWANVAKRNATVIGFGVALAWILGLRFGAHAVINIQGLTWVAIIITLAVSVGLYRPLARHSRTACENAPPMPLTSPERVNIAGEASGTRREVRYAGMMFILSGFAGIMYEVLFSKALALTFGSTSTAAYTVLATYMGGMAIGSWLGGRVASGHAQPLRLYAYCELAIAVYCAATPMIFKGMQGVYLGIASGVSPDAQILTVFRLTLGIGALLVPTILMGMTLPILARFFESRSHSLGRSVAVLYGANTLGAALGALMAGYFVLPTLGVQRTTLAAAAINMFVALMAMQLHKRVLAKPQASNINAGEARTFTPPKTPLQLDGAQAKWLGNLALVILGVGGIVTLAIEIKYFHMLSVVAGNSTYAFSLMLFTFLLGLGAGAEVARRLLQRRLPLRLLLGWLEFGLAVVILGGVFLWSKMPDYFGRFGAYPMVREFGSREIVRGVVCWLAMFPPALFIGAIYPVAMECIGRAHAANPIQALGRAAAFNTLGNIAGVILGAFILLPHLGALHSIQLLAVVCMILGTVTLWRERGTTRIYRWAPAALAALLLLAQPNSFDYDKLATGSNVYFFPQAWGRVIDHAESVDGGLTSVAVQEFKDHPPIRTLLTNGKFQGNDANTGEMQAQLGIALSSLLHTSHRESALAIGYGTGVSARTLHEAGFKQLDVVDLSADILRMANKHFASVNDRVTEKAGVSTYVTDGRNFLMLQERRYDLIGMEISSIWFAGAASLYNQEFYKLVKKRLQPHGVLQQWMQLHHTGKNDMLRILGSVRAEFEYVWLYLIGGQGIIIASNDASAEPEHERAELINHTPAMKPLLDIFHEDPANLLKTLLLDPRGTDRLLNAFGVPASAWVSTDDNLFLEYSTPKGNVLDGIANFESNKQFILSHSGKAPGSLAAQLGATATRND